MQQHSLGCSVCSKYLFNHSLKVKCNYVGCSELLTLCHTDNLAINRCNTCKIWKNWYCKPHFIPCVICKSPDNMKCHLEFHKIECTVCKFALQVGACCHHDDHDK